MNTFRSCIIQYSFRIQCDLFSRLILFFKCDAHLSLSMQIHRRCHNYTFIFLIFPMIWLLVSPQQRKSIDGAHDTRIAYICPVHLCEWIKLHYLHLIFEILRFGYVNSNGDIAGAIVFWHSFENNID